MLLRLCVYIVVLIILYLFTPKYLSGMLIYIYKTGLFRFVGLKGLKVRSYVFLCLGSTLYPFFSVIIR